MSGDDAERAAEIVGLCRERMERGEAVDVDAVAREHPDLAPRLGRLLGGLRMLDRAYARTGGAAATPSRAGRTLGAYRLVRELGAGGMGAVYLATVERPAAGLDVGARVAVKAPHPHLCARPGFLARFLREAEIGRRVRHRNVVRTFDVGEAEAGDERVPFLVMEYVEGKTLRALLSELARLPEELCRHVGRETASALAAIHAEGAVHRDLKPDNVLITRDHVVKVMDLGVARVADESMRLSQSGAFVGSLLYGAPEQFTEGRAIDGRADLHALGLLLYELSTGVHPLGGDDVHVVVRRLIEERPRRAGEVNPQLSPFFEELVARLLEKDRENRPARADDVARILEEGEESAWWRERSQALRRESCRPLRRIRIPRETALYGRENEIAVLRSLYERASKGEGQAVLVEGEAGIGKSRLVDEFAGRLAEAGEDVEYLFGSYPPGGAATASGAFDVAYRERLADDDAIRAALPQTPLLVPSFSALLRGDAAPAGAEPLTKASLHATFVQATRTLASRRPTIVLIDDLHFAPEEGRALFAALALAVPGHRILLVGCARPSLDDPWAAQLAAAPQATRLVLPRLGPKELVRLLRDALGSERLADELSALVAVKSDGNPFFVFELLRGLREGQFLRRRPDGTWETTQIIRDIRPPSTITELVRGRVADLDVDDRNLLDVASCCGFEFDAPLVAAALRRDRVEVLQSLGLIERRRRLVRAAGRRFVFDHHQVQEALYGGLSELLREEYHARLGEALETQSGAAAREAKDVAGATCVELADHLLKGAKGTRASRYLDGALACLEAAYLNEQAIALADRALAVPGLLTARPRCEMLLRTAGRLDVLARRVDERAALEQAAAEAESLGDVVVRARVRLAMGVHFFRTGDHAAARSDLERARALAAAGGDDGLAARAAMNLGNVAFATGDRHEARSNFERVLARAVESGDRELEAKATLNLAITSYDLGRFDESRLQGERALLLARRSGSRKLEASATGNLGNTLNAMGRYEEALPLAERDLAISREIGDRLHECLATANLGNAYYFHGRYASARSTYERHLALARELGDRTEEAMAFSNLGVVWLELGDPRRAGDLFSESIELARRVGAERVEAGALRGLGEAADAQDDFGAARRLYEESLELRRRTSDHVGVSETSMMLGDLLCRTGDVAGGRRIVEEAVARSSEERSSADLAFGMALLACLAGGDAEAAVAALAAAGSGAATPRTSFLLWKATGDATHLAAAKRGLDLRVAHAPPERREAMVENVRLHREIVAAAREHGVG
jgi:serine/threonine protein kinase/tetratricopeptide (TPR) repeat protein